MAAILTYVKPVRFDTVSAMNSEILYEYLERISNLLRTDVRRAGIGKGLQPVQMEALHYLSRCNRYSNTPVAVADFLGLTKGTVSQTLGVLEANGLLEKKADVFDRRVVHLVLTEIGRSVIAECIPPKVLEAAVCSWTDSEREQASSLMNRILRGLQKANGLKTFGVCETCHHHQCNADGSRRCCLTTEILSDADAGMVCREHQPLELSEPHPSA